MATGPKASIASLKEISMTARSSIADKNPSTQAPDGTDPSQAPDAGAEQAQLAQWCERLAHGPADDAQVLLAHIKRILKVQPFTAEDGQEVEQVASAPAFDINEANDKGLRLLDVLCRGRDQDESCFAAMHLLQAGADAAEQPGPSEAAPLHTCAYHGNWRMLGTLLDLGVDSNGLSSGGKQQLLGANALHALATGFRSARAQDYAECFGALLGAGCDVDARDRKRQTALDIAVRTAATTGDTTLTDAMFEYGVNIEGDSQLGASAVAQALSRRTGSAKIMSQLSASAFGAVARSIDALQALAAQAPDPSINPKP